MEGPKTLPFTKSPKKIFQKFPRGREIKALSAYKGGWCWFWLENVPPKFWRYPYIHYMQSAWKWSIDYGNLPHKPHYACEPSKKSSNYSNEGSSIVLRICSVLLRPKQRPKRFFFSDFKPEEGCRLSISPSLWLGFLLLWSRDVNPRDLTLST